MRQIDLFSGRMLSSLVLALFFLGSCAKDETLLSTQATTLAKNESGKVAWDWIKLSLDLNKVAPGYTAPITTRAFAYLSIGMYECTVLGTDSQNSLGGQIQGLSRGHLPALPESGAVNWSLVVNEAMYVMNLHFYRNTTPITKELIQNLHDTNVNNISESEVKDVISRSVSYGSLVGKAIIEYSLTDGQDNAYLNNYPSDYIPPTGQGLWVAPNNQKKPMLPYWGQIRTFMESNGGSIEMKDPPVFSSEKESPFYAYALEVRNRVRNLNKAEVEFVKYWNDEKKEGLSPSGHLFSILVQILESQDKDLAYTTQAFAKLGIALHDATVATWKIKYTYNTINPENYIKSYIDQNFFTLINTPATPEYASGQASLAHAATEVLSELFGYNFPFTDKSYENRKDIDGSPRSYKSFQHMSEEVTLSSLYGGIHFRFSLEVGSQQGSIVGRNVNTLKF
ncbi:MAG: vanadium-dependent haloperoxidase [Bacteroidota bacterium]|nr:vanadium-dependent haloperoxidase [Bacteroidota bacterium]